MKNQVSQRADEIRLTKLMMIVFFSFLICFLPLMIVNVFDSKFRIPVIHVLASILAWMSSCINPIIYAVLNRQYRQAYIRLFCPRERSTSTVSRSGSGSAYSKTLVSDVFIYHPASNKMEKKQAEDKI
ncbi:protein trapped in endoderm-1-like [Centruroides sculpturatus]|uniref:protein trapped in endoderm-1-like n=1 Tax=Centruroides sculpturatus TaxID=218467 RepID=UPI000C6C9A67|nr:protein trapped in endoderm-1-like [Centruroides sculpturatus]